LNEESAKEYGVNGDDAEDDEAEVGTALGFGGNRALGYERAGGVHCMRCFELMLIGQENCSVCKILALFSINLHFTGFNMVSHQANLF
jgi:hypothetical protein